MILVPSSKAGGSSWKTLFIILAVMLGGYLYHELTLDQETDIGYLCKTQAYVKVYKQVYAPSGMTFTRVSKACEKAEPNTFCFDVEDFGTRKKLGVVGVARAYELPTGSDTTLVSLTKTHREYRSENSGELLAETLQFNSVRKNWFPLMHPRDAKGCSTDQDRELFNSLFIPSEQ